jgi:hypothetical protein
MESHASAGRAGSIATIAIICVAPNDDKSILYDSNDTTQEMQREDRAENRNGIMNNLNAQTVNQEPSDRRRGERFAGPFDGCRIGMLETPLSIFDLSRGGCFVNSMFDETPGVRFTMKIQLPPIGVITLQAETLYGRSGFGFAVRFVDMDDETGSVLDLALEHLHDG